jgi:hypothetical protein
MLFFVSVSEEKIITIRLETNNCKTIEKSLAAYFLD